MQDDLTTLVCLFHHEDQAKAAVRDLRNASIPGAAISIIGGDGSGIDALDKSELSSLRMPDRDYDRLKAGVKEGAIVVAVSSIQEHVSVVESIFAGHRAEKIDEAEASYREPGRFEGERTIPVVAEDMVVGKRTVDQGGLRLYRRIVEIPVEESVKLREEHVNVRRMPVDRAITDEDRAFQDRTMELTETAEEAVVSKSARVVEEVVLSKDTLERTETVRDSVRRTEIDIEELPGTGAAAGKTTGTY